MLNGFLGSGSLPLFRAWPQGSRRMYSQPAEA
jgi:hypothetical protein